MKRYLLTICLIGSVPFMANAQFPGRIHDLKIPQSQQLQEKITRQITTVVDEKNNVMIISDSILNFTKGILTAMALNERISDVDIAAFNGLAKQLKGERDSLKRELIERTIEVFKTHSTGDSLIAEYKKLVGAKLTDTIGPFKAKFYREIIDKEIVTARQYQKDKYKELDESRYTVSKNVCFICFGKCRGTKKKDLPLSDDSSGRSTTTNIMDPIPDLADKNSIQNGTYMTTVVKKINDSIEPQSRLIAQARNYFHYLYRSEDNPVSKPWWIPLRSITHAEFFYFGENGERLEVLTNFAIQSNFTNNATVSTEILSGIIPFEAGGKKNPRRRFSLPVKFDLGMTISKEAIDTMNAERKDISGLMYGGLLHTRLSYPIFYSNWKCHNGKGIRTYIPITGTFNWDSKAGDDKQLTQLYYFGEIAANLYMEIDLIQSVNARADAAIFLNTKMAFLAGGSEFQKNHRLDQKDVWLWQFNGGIRVKDRYSIAVNLPVWASGDNTLEYNKIPSIAVLIDPNF